MMPVSIWVTKTWCLLWKKTRNENVDVDDINSELSKITLCRAVSHSDRRNSKHNAHLRCKCGVELWFYVVILCERDPNCFFFTDVRYVATVPIIRFQTAILSRSIREISWAEKRRGWVRQKMMVVALYALSQLLYFLILPRKMYRVNEPTLYDCNLMTQVLAHM